MLSSRIAFDANPTTGSKQFLSPSTHRVGLVISPPAVGRVTLSNDPVISDGVGLVLQPGQAALRLTLREHGDVVQQGWFALYAAGSSGVGWIEVLG